MSFSAGTRLGIYEVGAQIGAGGMGEVYRATDTRLKRDVAIKVLPEIVRDDPERMARLQREAEVLAALNHPNIAHVYGIEEADGVRALVMELVEGPTLADRIEEGPVPVDEAMRLAGQVLAALEAAHERGIVHRDLKPANIKVRPDGTVKVLDFGLAKAFQGDGSGSRQTDPSPSFATMTSPAVTQMGVILGTAAYMSPEQAKGRPVDRRADVWAFGCVLYEMLTARRAFAGEDVSDTLANVLKVEASWDAMPASVPARMQQVIRACLQKNPKQRIETAQDVRLALDGAFESAAAAHSTPQTSTRSPVRQALQYLGVAIVAGLAVGLILWSSRPAAEPGVLTRFRYDVPGDQTFRNAGRPVLALSPDGRSLAYNANGGLFLRAMDDLEARVIPGTEPSLSSPFFSPDGEQIGYFQENALKRMPVRGGAAVVIAGNLSNPGAVHWASDGTILFGQPGGIMRVPASGGTPEVVVPLEEGTRIGSPQLLPGGGAVLFMLAGVENSSQIVAQSLRTGERTVLVDGGAFARFTPTGHLVYVYEGDLFGVGFDPERLAVTTAPVPLVQGIWLGYNWQVSSQGTLAYVGDATLAMLKAVWVNRDGSVQPINTIPGGTTPRLSPDGRQVLLEVENDLWIYELETGRRTRVTSGGGARPAWDPTGTRVAYMKGTQAWIAPADGSGEARQVTDIVRTAHPDSWSPDGRVLAFHRHTESNLTHLFTVAADDPGAEPVGLLEREFSAESTTFSPDGRYIAYMSNQSGDSEVYIRPFPGPGAQVTVSVGGGRQPVWARNGELFYRDMSGERMMAVTVKTEPTLEVGTPRELFTGTFLNILGSPRPQYDVTADGQRFLMLRPEGAAQASIIIVQNWFDELGRLVPLQKD